MDSKYFIIISIIILRNSILFYYFPNIYLLIIINSLELLCFYLFTNKSILSKKRFNQEILKIIQEKDLIKFKEYIKINKIDSERLTKMSFVGNITPFTYSISQESFDIFKYMIEYGVDLNYTIKNTLCPIILSCYYPPKEYAEELLKHKDKIDLYQKCSQFNANCLEIAIWRNRVDIVKLLINNGMNFSIEQYNKTICGSSLVPFSNLNIEVKKELIRNYAFNKKVDQFNLHDLIINKKIQINSLSYRPYVLENFLKYS